MSSSYLHQKQILIYYFSLFLQPLQSLSTKSLTDIRGILDSHSVNSIFGRISLVDSFQAPEIENDYSYLLSKLTALYRVFDNERSKV